MNSVEDDDFSHWDSLADELGLEPAPAAPKPAAQSKPAPKPEPVPLKEIPPVVESESEREPEPEPETKAMHIPDLQVERVSPVRQESEILETADTVLEEDELGDPESPEAEVSEETEGKEEGKGRRRRRRRRKKKGGGETPVAGVPVESEEAIKTPISIPVKIEVAKFVDSVVEESGVELLDDAPEELLDEGDDKTELTTAMDEELTEETARPSPEWKVVSWTELVGSLYRPER